MPAMKSITQIFHLCCFVGFQPIAVALSKERALYISTSRSICLASAGGLFKETALHSADSSGGLQG